MLTLRGNVAIRIALIDDPSLMSYIWDCYNGSTQRGGGLKMKGMPGNLQEIMRQVKRAQELLAKKQEELAELRIEATSGGGMVKVIANGREEILDIEIDKEVVDPEDVEMLEDLILAAIKEVQAKVKEVAQKEMGSLLGGLGLPNIPGLF